MRAPPVEGRGEGEWRIAGVYKHQVLKAGLRKLDETWSEERLFEFVSEGQATLDAGKGLMRQKLVKDMLAGTIRLQSIPPNDVTATQCDLRRLSLRQLLRLRVQLLDYTPSGCGSDTISTVGTKHEAFLRTLDELTLKLLGQKAVGELALNSDDMFCLGLEAVLFAAAAAGIPEATSQWWSWCLDGNRRVFFDPSAFACRSEFPEGGVLQVTDLSKRDKHEPSGRLVWFDWRVHLIGEEGQLAAKPLTQVISEDSAATAGEEAPGPAVASSLTSTQGLGISSNTLLGLRGALRKVQNSGTWDGVKTSTPRKAKVHVASTMQNTTPTSETGVAR